MWCRHCNLPPPPPRDSNPQFLLTVTGSFHDVISYLYSWLSTNQLVVASNGSVLSVEKVALGYLGQPGFMAPRREF